VAPTCGLLLHRQLSIDIGLFDERYFIGKEDGDFTHRMRLANYRILELPARWCCIIAVRAAAGFFTIRFATAGTSC
jgi:hypothetical protein